MSALRVMTEHALQPYWDLTLATVRADALRVALEWRLFDRLYQPLGAAELARQLESDPANTGYLLELLWNMQLLDRDDALRYRNSAVAQEYFCTCAARYCGDAWGFRLANLRRFGGQLAEQVSSGQPLTAGFAPGGWASAAKVQIAQEQRAVTADLAVALLAQLPEFAGARRLLDLGGGPGLVAIALATAHPQLQGEVFDFADTVAIAADNIRQAGLQQRLGVRAGDLDQDPLGEGFDLIWCSSVLHFVQDPLASLGRIRAALRPGGVLVCAQAQIPDDPSAAGRVLPYYLSMRMQGRHVTGAGGLQALAREAGFVGIECHAEVPFAVAPVSVLVARRGES